MIDFGSVWKTIRELDVAAIAGEAGHDVLLACVGDPQALAHVHDLVLGGPNRYPPPLTALALVPLERIGEHERLIAGVDLLLVALSSSAVLSAEEVAGLDRLAALQPRRRLLVVLGEPTAGVSPWLAPLDPARTAVVDPRAAEAADRLAGSILDALPGALRLSAARRLPGLRRPFARRLMTEVSVSNATVALASGIPSLVPVLGLPISAADTIVLTKNQVLMVYRLALAYGAPPEFQRRMAEITPVIGAAVVWRQVAGGLVGLVPGYGILPKTAVAYAGTYITGRVAELWYETGFVSKADLQRIRADATTKAKKVAADAALQVRAGGDKVGGHARNVAKALTWRPVKLGKRKPRA